jgi:hypothetical protein
VRSREYKSATARTLSVGEPRSARFFDDEHGLSIVTTELRQPKGAVGRSVTGSEAPHSL